MKARLGTNEEDDLETLFCSQLIGEAYKKMNILPDEIRSSNILPAHFEEKEIQPGNIPEPMDPIVSCLKSKLSKTIIFQQLQSNPTIRTRTDISCVASNEEFAVHSVKISSTDTVAGTLGKKFTVCTDLH